MLIYFVFLILSSAIAAALRIYAILPKHGVKHRRRTTRVCKLGVFLGSGGHTTEALALLESVSFSRYGPRVYFVCEGDAFSEQKVVEFEKRKETTDPTYVKDYNIIVLPRARRVHQPILTTPPTALVSLVHALYYLTYLPLATKGAFVDVLLMNGPGTCFILCVAAYFSKFIGVTSPRLLYVESFARVNRLSLSGRLLRPLADRFIVQWPELLQDGARSECRGWLV